MSWLEKILPKSKITTPRRHNIPEGVWTKCTACEQVLYRAELERNLEVCPKCDHHMRISARARLESFLDAEGRSEVAAEPIDDVVDTTGAGDLFAAGFLAGLAEGRPIADCLTMGALCAREIIAQVGPRAQTDLRAKVAERLG